MTGECKYTGDGATDKYRQFLGIACYDSATTITLPTGTDYVVVLPLWVASMSISRAFYNIDAVFGSYGYAGEHIVLEKVGDSGTFNATYHFQNGKKTETVTVTFASATTVTTSASLSGGVMLLAYKTEE